MSNVRIPVQLDQRGFRGSVRAVQRDVDKFRSTMERQSRVIQNTLRFSIVFTGLSQLPRLTEGAARFQDQIISLGVKAGISGQQLDGLKNSVLDFARASTFTTEEAAATGVQLAKMGLSANAIEKALPAAMRAAEAAGEGLEGTTATIGRTVNALGLTVRDYGRVADVLAVASVRGDVTIDTMAGSLKNAAPAAAGLSLSLEQLTAMITLMGDRGIHAEKAGTGIKTMMVSLVSRTEKANRVLSKYGTQVEIVNGNVTNTVEIFEALRAGNAGQADLFNIFGSEALLPATALVATDQEKWQQLLGNLQNASGEAQRMADEMQKGLAGSMRKMSSAFDVAMKHLTGGSMLEFQQAVVDKITGFINFLNDNSKVLKAFGVAVTGVAVALGTAGLALAANVVWKTFIFAVQPLKIAWIWIKGIGNMAVAASIKLRLMHRSMARAAAGAGMGKVGLGGQLKYLAAQFRLLAVRMIPITIKLGLIAAAVAGVYLAFAYLYRYWDEVVAFGKKIWGGIAEWFKSNVTVPLTIRIAAIGEAFSDAFDFVKQKWDQFVAWISPAIEWIGGLLDKVGITGAVELVGKVAEQVGKDATQAVNDIKEVGKTVGGALVTGAKHAIETGKQPIQDAVNALFGGTQVGATGEGGEGAAGAGDGGGIVGQFKAAGEAIKEDWGNSMEVVAGDTESAFQRVTRSVADSRMQVARESIAAITEVNKAAFKSARVAKGVAVADAIWNGARAVQRAFAEFPFPYSGIVATLMTAKTAAQVATIKNTDFRGQAHSGLENVPSTGTYLLERGEMVATRAQNAGLQDFLQRERSGVGQPTYVQIESNTAGGGFSANLSERELEELNERLARLAQRGMHSVSMARPV